MDRNQIFRNFLHVIVYVFTKIELSASKESWKKADRNKHNLRAMIILIDTKFLSSSSYGLWNLGFQTDGRTGRWTYGHTNINISTLLSMLIKKIYNLCGLPSSLLLVRYIFDWHKVKIPLYPSGKLCYLHFFVLHTLIIFEIP